MLGTEVAEAQDSIVNQCVVEVLVAEWRKAIPEARDRMQSRVLVWVVVSILLLSATYLAIDYILYIHRVLSDHPLDSQHVVRTRAMWHFITPITVSLTFGLLVWRTRAATPGGIFCGMLICYSIIPWTRATDLPHSGLVPLVGLFLFTSIATWAGKQRKRALGLAEGPRGRSAAQVIANLGFAGLIAGTPWPFFVYDHLGPTPWIHHPWFEPLAWASSTMFLAAVCEATADTVSSEVGQAFGGKPMMLTSLRPVPPGTDGGVSLVGTAAGILAAALVALAGFG